MACVVEGLRGKKKETSRDLTRGQRGRVCYVSYDDEDRFTSSLSIIFYNELSKSIYNQQRYGTFYKCKCS
jgi:hypothetical protein